MDLRLFLSTFVLIFLAELGDKTQLATMARAATQSAPWSVFLGAAVALVASTVVAVLLGSVLNAVAPPFVIKAAAGALFLVFGGILIVSAVRAAGEAPPEAEAQAVAPMTRGFLASLTLESALAFEEASAAHYADLAEAEADEDMKRLWSWLAEEESQHVQAVRKLASGPAIAEVEPKEETPLPPLPPLSIKAVEEARQAMSQAVKYEEATAGFYDALARATHIPAAARTLRALAQDERQHARALAETQR